MVRLIFFLLCTLHSVSAFSQNPSRLESSRLVLELPSDFTPLKDSPGFGSTKGHSTIRIYEMDLPLSFDEWSAKQISRILEQGFDTFDVTTGSYNGLSSYQFYFSDPTKLNQENFAIVAGKQNFQLNVVASYTPKRKEEMVTALLTAKFDDSFSIDKTNVLGFSADHSRSKLTKVGHSGVSIRYEQRDSANVLTTYLGLTKTEKRVLQGKSLSASASSIRSTYFPSSTLISETEQEIDDEKSLTQVIETNREPYVETNIITIIRTKDFDIVCVGGTSVEENVNALKGIIESIKLQ